MMRRLDTLVARLILVSLVGISLVHVLSIWSYESALDRELARANATQLADRIVMIKRSVVAVAEADREALAHELSSGPLEAHWNRTRGAASGGVGAEQWQGVVTGVLAAAPELRTDDVVLGTGGDPHAALMSLRLPDGSWINVNLFASTHPSHAGHGHGRGALLSTSIMAGGVVLLALFVARWLTGPLRSMAQAVSAMEPGSPGQSLPERGPTEVRQLAAAFNVMRARIADLVQRRTHALAAVSHDLRTPLTRLRLRLDEVRDTPSQEAMLADIAEMEGMIDATLSYLRGHDTGETPRKFDVAALLATVVDAAHDAGHDVTLAAPPGVVVLGRPLALKRALTNLVDNAVTFAGTVAVSSAADVTDIIIEISDDGPGIPEDKLAEVLEPFVRLETSRNRQSGGVGLGLAIARAGVEANGGTLTLRNRPAGGLVAEVRLPAPVS